MPAEARPHPRRGRQSRRARRRPLAPQAAGLPSPHRDRSPSHSECPQTGVAGRRPPRHELHAGRNQRPGGFYWLQQIGELDPTAVVLLITAYGDVEMAVRAVKEGSRRFCAQTLAE